MNIFTVEESTELIAKHRLKKCMPRDGHRAPNRRIKRDIYYGLLKIHGKVEGEKKFAEVKLDEMNKIQAAILAKDIMFEAKRLKEQRKAQRRAEYEAKMATEEAKTVEQTDIPEKD